MVGVRCTCLATTTWPVLHPPDSGGFRFFPRDEVVSVPGQGSGFWKAGTPKLVLRNALSPRPERVGLENDSPDASWSSGQRGAASGATHFDHEGDASVSSSGCSAGHVSVGQDEHEYLDGSPLHFRRNMIASSLAFAVLAPTGWFSDAVKAEAAEQLSPPSASADVKPSPFPVSTESWYRYRGQGFVVKVPPDFEDLQEPEEFVDTGDSLYGERAKAKPFAARFGSVDRKEVLSIVIKPASQLKLSFFEADDITALGSLEDAAKIFVPVGAKIIGARSLLSDNARGTRTYYLYEFVTQDKRVAMVAGVSSGQVYVAGAMAPQSRWRESAAKLRTAALSFSIR